MTLATAQQLAQRCANNTGGSVVVYQDLHKLDGVERYNYDFTLPAFGKRIGERIYPQDVHSKEQTEDANRVAVLRQYRNLEE
jgi:hypothetical protein